MKGESGSSKANLGRNGSSARAGSVPEGGSVSRGGRSLSTFLASDLGDLHGLLQEMLFELHIPGFPCVGGDAAADGAYFTEVSFPEEENTPAIPIYTGIRPLYRGLRVHHFK